MGIEKHRTRLSASNHAGFSYWSPDAPPLVAGALDVEWGNLNALPAGWHEYDPGNIQAISFDGRGLILTQTPHSPNIASGVYIALPLGENADTFATSLCPGGHTDDEAISVAGLAFWEDATDPSKALWTFGESWSDLYYLYQYTSYNAETTGGGYSLGDLFGAYMRARRNGGTIVTFEVSALGLSFASFKGHPPPVNSFVAITLPFTPKHVGLAMDNANSPTVSQQAVFKWFRHKNSDVGLTGRLDGARVNGFYV